MKNTLAMLAACTGLIALPVAAMSADAMMKPAMNATMMCRPAMAGEKAMAMMGSKPLVCKMLPKMDKMGPGMKGSTAAEQDAMWQKWMAQNMAIPQAGGVGG